MMNYTKRILALVSLILIFGSCKKKAFDEYYGRPDSLQPPIYQVLQSKGNFTNFLACIDKAKYKDILSAAGSWTIFAPNDEAFKNFFTDRGIAGMSQLDSGTCSQIVTYALAYNAFRKENLDDFQSSAGYISNLAYKRRTANYTGFYDDTVLNNLNGTLAIGQKVKALAANRNTGFILGDNNNKHIPYFTDNFLAAKKLTAADYNYFYPTSVFTGFNVVDAKVVTADMFAENGYINEVDKVLLPLPNIDRYLASNPQYSEFKKLFDKYMVNFVLNAEATNRYKLLTGLPDNIYIKTYNNALAFALNNENYLKLQDNDAQTEGWTMFVPKNDVLLNYINTVLLENYPANSTFDALQPEVKFDFINAHMFQTSVWPSKFSSINNVQNEPAKFDAQIDVIDKKVLSNGLFYGTNKVQQANVFATVFGRVYLDPNYSLMKRLLDLNYRFLITVPTLKFTLIMLSDAVLRQWGYDYSVTGQQWTFRNPTTGATSSGSGPLANLQRILAMHIIPTPKGELDNVSGTGIVESINGEYIKYNAGKFISAGSQDSGYVVTVTGTKLSSNGRVYYVTNLLNYTTRPLGTTINTLGTAPLSPYSFFNQYLRNSTLINTATNEILVAPPGGFYTVFIPTNTAIQNAVNAGLLPGTGAGPVKTPNFAPTLQVEKDLVLNFLSYHILTKATVVADGNKTGQFETAYKKANGDPGFVTINSTPGTLRITDAFGKIVNVDPASANYLGDRAVIHLISDYLKYNPN